MYFARYFLLLSVLLWWASPSLALAALTVGDKAPDFTVDASQGGKVFSFELAKALKKGPVVLYFYPAAFTHGCTLEAHNFAEAVDDFKAQGAMILGISHDSLETLNKFSISECRSKFAVGADTNGDIMKAYDAVMMPSLLGLSTRTSYVIAPDHTILYVYSAMDPDQHVANTLQALRAWRGHRLP